ncbi:PfkB family carbohydrate kinase [Microcella alkalica]|uniref:1-phosphofructokinase n=1 Tax=Microcella alkalica TaxID=355930 RepID=A0A839E4Z8_9MICO|nr:PfkB family carbohydrate kinase [Microcella alkalica]MBA8847749.1 1-phosphofructokinase [Microcella alkalica]
MSRTPRPQRETGDEPPSGRVVVFAPAPLLTITIEAGRRNGDVHVHAGGQGIWQARMLAALGADVTICASFGGETGRVTRTLLLDEGFRVVGVEREDGNAAYVHDRRDGDRSPIVETDDPPLSRHELDELYAIAIRESMAADVVLLSGPAGDDVLPADTYRRLAADLEAFGCLVIADLAGERLVSALEGGLDVVKTSHEELAEDGRIDEDEKDDENAIIRAIHRLNDEGAATVIVSRASDGVLALVDGTVLRVTTPDMKVVDTKGAGDSLTAGVAATLAGDAGDARRAIVVGAAAGALNVTRHGLGTGEASTILAFAEHVDVTELNAAPADERED